MDSIITQIRTLANGASHDARRKIVDSLRDLAISLEGPEDTYNRMETMFLDAGMAKVALDLKLFDILTANKRPMTTPELAEKTGAAPILLGRLLRCMASSRLVNEVAENTYEASNVSSSLVTPLGQAMTKFSIEIMPPILLAIPDFLKKNGYKDVTDPKNTPLQIAYHTELTSYEYFRTRPEWAHDMILMLKGRREGVPGWLSVYPVQESAEIDPQRPLLVDVGGGAGWQCEELKREHPYLPGRIILQDQAMMLAHVTPTKGIEAMEHDFFTPQPVKGAKYYYMRNIMHNYADEKALQILRHLRDALSDDSLILVDDIVLPDFKAPSRSVKMDMFMMAAHGAIERTEKQWNELFDSAGLKIVQTREYRDILQGCSVTSLQKA